jgi:hypothetical protein
VLHYLKGPKSSWLLSAYFVRASEAVEQETAAWAGARKQESGEEADRG